MAFDWLKALSLHEQKEPMRRGGSANVSDDEKEQQAAMASAAASTDTPAPAAPKLRKLTQSAQSVAPYLGPDKAIPPRVVPSHLRLAATVWYWLLVGIFVAYAIFSAVDMYKGRNDPPASYTRQSAIDQLSFQLPWFTFCRPYGQNGYPGDAVEFYDGTPFTWITTCNTLTSAGATPCDYSYDTVYPSVNSSCVVMNLTQVEIGANEPALGLLVGIIDSSSEYEWVTGYMTDFNPAQINYDWGNAEESYDIEWFWLGNVVTMKVTKQTTRYLELSHHHFIANPHTTTTFSLTTSFQRQEETANLTMFMRSDPLGPVVIKQTDPVNYYTYFGVLIGSFGFIFMFFALVFGEAMAVRQDELLGEKVRKIVGDELGHNKPAEEASFFH